MMSWTNYHTLINNVDGLVFEHPCDPDVCNTSDNVGRMLGFYREMKSAGCCAIMLPHQNRDNLMFLAALATYLDGPLVAIADAGDDVSWKTWASDHGGLIYYYDTPYWEEDDYSHMLVFAQFDDGYWLASTSTISLTAGTITIRATSWTRTNAAVLLATALCCRKCSVLCERLEAA